MVGDARQVGMYQPGQHHCFPLELFLRRLGSIGIFFDGNQATGQIAIRRQIDGAHATFPQHTLDGVAPLLQLIAVL